MIFIATQYNCGTFTKINSWWRYSEDACRWMGSRFRPYRFAMGFQVWPLDLVLREGLYSPLLPAPNLNVFNSSSNHQLSRPRDIPSSLLPISLQILLPYFSMDWLLEPCMWLFPVSFQCLPCGSLRLPCHSRGGVPSGILGFFLASFSSELWMMYPTYGLFSGFGHRTIYNSSMLVVLQHFVKWRSVAVGVVTAASSVAMFAITQVTQALLNAFGWRGAVRGFAHLYFICGLCSSVYLPVSDPQKCENKRDRDEKDESQSCSSSVLRNRSFWVFSVSTIVVVFSFYVPFVHIVSWNKFDGIFNPEQYMRMVCHSVIDISITHHVHNP